jgi:hypothetical protein
MMDLSTGSKPNTIGTSHADGSFRGSDVSIPTAYCFDKNGDAIFVSKNDVRTRMLDTQTKTVSFLV